MLMSVVSGRVVSLCCVSCGGVMCVTAGGPEAILCYKASGSPVVPTTHCDRLTSGTPSHLCREPGPCSRQRNAAAPPADPSTRCGMLTSGPLQRLYSRFFEGLASLLATSEDMPYSEDTLNPKDSGGLHTSTESRGLTSKQKAMLNEFQKNIMPGVPLCASMSET
jgi:hypothetical protein